MKKKFIKYLDSLNDRDRKSILQRIETGELQSADMNKLIEQHQQKLKEYSVT